jgi:hypothetical protein
MCHLLMSRRHIHEEAVLTFAGRTAVMKLLEIVFGVRLEVF